MSWCVWQKHSLTTATLHQDTGRCHLVKKSLEPICRPQGSEHSHPLAFPPCAAVELHINGTDGVFCVWLLLADFPFLWGSPGRLHAGVAHSFLLHSSMWTQARGWPTRQLTDILDASSLWRFCIKLYKHSHKALVGKYVLFLLVTKWLHVWHPRDSSDCLPDDFTLHPFPWWDLQLPTYVT